MRVCALCMDPMYTSFSSSVGVAIAPSSSVAAIEGVTATGFVTSGGVEGPSKVGGPSKAGADVNNAGRNTASGGDEVSMEEKGTILKSHASNEPNRTSFSAGANPFMTQTRRPNVAFFPRSVPIDSVPW